jgi:hypothetical protein
MNIFTHVNGERSVSSWGKINQRATAIDLRKKFCLVLFYFNGYLISNFIPRMRGYICTVSIAFHAMHYSLMLTVSDCVITLK